MRAVSKLLVPALGVGAILCGCAAEEAAPEPSSVGLRVSRVEMGKDWPLTVKDGTVTCDGIKDWGRLYFERDGQRFALNGAAMMDEAKTPDIFKSGWSIPDPVIPKSYKSIGPLQDRARSTCQ